MAIAIDLGLPLPSPEPFDFRAFLNGETLIRLHPHWHVQTIAQHGWHTTARLKDHATERSFDLSFSLHFPGDNEFTIALETGPVAQVHFFPGNATLSVSFSPRSSPLSPDQEQDLTLWLQSIRQYLRLYLKTTPLTVFFRYLMNKVLLKMNPSQRKICLMLYRFTMVEIVVILIIVAGYFCFGPS
jgi:hypothetical protein